MASSGVRCNAQTPAATPKMTKMKTRNLLRALISITRSMKGERPGCKAAASGEPPASSFTILSAEHEQARLEFAVPFIHECNVSFASRHDRAHRHDERSSHIHVEHKIDIHIRLEL